MPVDRIPDYDGAGVYALVDTSGDMYIGSSMHCKRRIKEHSSGNTSPLIRAALESGIMFRAVILEEMPEASDDSLIQAEKQHIKEAGAKAAYNLRKTIERSVRQRPPSDRPRTIAEYARTKGVTTQAVYKRLAKAGIDPYSLRKAKAGRQIGGDLSEEGLAILDKAMSGDIPTVNGGISTINQPSTMDASPEVVALRAEVEELRKAAADAHHRAELADVKAAAAENERDYLREQLDAAIKANALASMKRLTAPEEQSNTADQQQLSTLKDRIKAAWHTIRGK